MYLKVFRNRITQSFILPLHETLQGLMSMYGKLNPKHFMTAENALEAFQYYIKLPVDIVFDSIDDLSELAEVAYQLMTELQKNSIAFIIFQNTGKFKSDLKNWLRKPNVDQTWSDMKIYFRHALQDIRNVDDIPVSETFDQENMIQEGLEGVRNIVRNQVTESLPNFPPPQYTPIYDPPPQNQGRANEMNFAPYQQANVINAMPYVFANAVGQQQPLFSPQKGAQMHLPTPPSHQQ